MIMTLKNQSYVKFTTLEKTQLLVIKKEVQLQLPQLRDVLLEELVVLPRAKAFTTFLLKKTK